MMSVSNMMCIPVMGKRGSVAAVISAENKEDGFAEDDEQKLQGLAIMLGPRLMTWKEKKSASTRINSIEKKQLGLKQELRERDEEIKRLRATIATQGQESQERQTYSHEREREFEALRHKLSKAQAEIDAKKKEKQHAIEQAEKTVEEMRRKDAQRLSNLEQKLIGKIQRMQEEKDGFAKELEKTRKAKEETEEKAKRALERLSELEKKFDAQEVVTHQLRNREQQLESKLKQTEELVIGDKDVLARKATIEREAMESRLREAQGRNSNLQREVETMRKERDSIHTQLQEAKTAQIVAEKENELLKRFQEEQRERVAGAAATPLQPVRAMPAPGTSPTPMEWAQTTTANR